jgi:uncharacterized membrane protein YhaH (DUF805 family)
MGNLVQLFTTLDGRINRRPFWMGVIVLIIAAIVVSFILMTIMGVSVFSMAAGGFDADAMMATARTSAWVSLIAWLIFLYPSAALMIKRRHDRGSSGIEVWVLMGLNALTVLMQALGIGYTVQEFGTTMIVVPGLLNTILSIASGLLGLFLLVVCGFLSGTPGANAYGPDPLGGSAE